MKKEKALELTLSKMDIKELYEIRKQVDDTITEIVNENMSGALLAVERVARDHGYDLDQLISLAQQSDPASPRYANPDNPDQTWCGRGRVPDWIPAALKAGWSIDDISIG
ncbi:H-NS histone family protein [Paracoccus sp. (in: a-proteobacteria)]|uniref:H-NS histone family protein n=1 Tax=Paracoccus sp. TaxID=267 RepID=UPI0028AA1067|nr:H-NS histone family protein [Paracoccus sp. (in: a-proteobacteria)]